MAAKKRARRGKQSLALAPPQRALRSQINPKKKASSRKRTKKVNGLSLTQAGMDFMKSALAPPDFATGTFQGIPDEYYGRVLTKSFTSTSTLGGVLTDGLETWIIKLPIPGVAYLYGQVNASGVLSLETVLYPNFSTLFPTGFEGTNFQSFRYAGSALEIIPTVNAMTWSGSVHCFRGQVDLQTQALATASLGFLISGLTQIVNSTRPDMVHPFNLGCYAPARQTQADFPFHELNPATTFSEISISGLSSGKSVIWTAATGLLPFVGCGSMEAIFYKIPSWSNTGNLMTLRTWDHLEFQVNSQSALYEYAHISPPYDPVALALVKRAYMDMMMCVPYYENEGLWAKILAFISRASKTLSILPGPVGDIASGVSTISDAIQRIVI